MTGMNDMMGMQGGYATPSPQAIKAIEDAPCIKCECGCKTFSEALVFKKVPGLYFGQKEPVMKAIPVYVCTECGKIMKDMLEDPKMAKFLGEGKEQEVVVAESSIIEQDTPHVILNSKS